MERVAACWGVRAGWEMRGVREVKGRFEWDCQVPVSVLVSAALCAEQKRGRTELRTTHRYCSHGGHQLARGRREEERTSITELEHSSRLSIVQEPLHHRHAFIPHDRQRLWPNIGAHNRLGGVHALNDVLRSRISFPPLPPERQQRTISAGSAPYPHQLPS